MGADAAPTGVNRTSATGFGGSMARFTIVEPFLYALHESYIQLVRINDPVNPSLWSTVDVGWGIETIFPYGNYLFIGSTTGMFLYDNTNPENPTQLSAFAHVTSCDPVVAQGDYAYVTLRAGSFCGGGVNRLDILDITELTNPLLVESYAMQGPFGLGWGARAFESPRRGESAADGLDHAIAGLRLCWENRSSSRASDLPPDRPPPYHHSQAPARWYSRREDLT
jgi:hypothetical protein